MSARSIHPFPARMAPEIALDAIPHRDSNEPITVIDPMCGSGTVLAAAVARGHNAVGVDIDPLAVMMSTVATAPIDTDSLAQIAKEVRAVATTIEGPPPWSDTETDQFVDYWFGPTQKMGLIALTNAIRAVPEESIRLALQVALSRIIITKTPQASLAADTSHSRPHRVMESSAYDVMKGFARSVISLQKMLEGRSVLGSATVHRGDSRSLDGISDNSIDMAVTSPPYLNALDYMRGHKLALVWFGHSIPELRKLRGTSIGAERRPDTKPSDRVLELVSYIESDARDRSVLPLGIVQRFAGDMSTFSGAIHRVLKPSGKAVLVVGNSTLRGNYIRNDVIALKAMEHTGFHLNSRVEREIPTSSRYMAINAKTSRSTIENRMRSEVVITMTKNS